MCVSSLFFLLGCGLLVCLALPNMVPRSAGPEAVSTEITALEAISNDVALLEKRNPGLAIIAVASIVFSSIS